MYLMIANVICIRLVRLNRNKLNKYKMSKEQIINRHARNLKSLIGTGLAQDECNEIIKYAVNEALTLYGVVKSLPSKEVIISEAVKYQDDFLDDPHSIADEAFIEGCNFILTALQEEKVIR